MDFLTLDLGGVVLSVIMGVLFIIFGGSFGFFFLLAMIVFLVLSAIVTWIGIRSKRRLGIGQEPRGIKNVLANGIPPLTMALIFYLFALRGSTNFAILFMIGMLAAVAAITADKFNSEIGVLSSRLPRMIFTWRKVKKGTSGGMSALGVVAGILAAFAVALLIFIVLPQIMAVYVGSFSAIKAMIAITVAGFLGSVVDSILGYYEEKGIGNKFTSNFVCGEAAGIIAIIIFLIL